MNEPIQKNITFWKYCYYYCSSSELEKKPESRKELQCYSLGLRVCLILQITLFSGLVPFLGTTSTISSSQNGLIVQLHIERLKEGIKSERFHTKWSWATQSDANTNQSDRLAKRCLKCNVKYGPTWIVCKVSGFLFNHQRRREALAGRTTNHGVVFVHRVVVLLLKALRWEGDVWLRHLPLVHRTSFPWHCRQRRKRITGFR